MGRKIGSVISPPPRFHRFIKLWEYCPLSLPRKKEKEKNKQRYKQKNKQNKTENKNRKYTHFASKKPSKTLWRMSHNFFTMLSLSYWHVAVKNVTTRCCNVTLFFLDSTVTLGCNWVTLSRACVDMVEYRVTYLHLVLPVFVCIQKSSPFLKPRVSSE